MKKLYKIKLRGLNKLAPYVVAENATEAYTKVKKWLDKEALGFDFERELMGVEIIAEEKGRWGATEIEYKLFV